MRSKFFDKESHYHLGRPDHCSTVKTFLAENFDADKTCLEIGAGNGLGTNLLANYFDKVIAIEPVADLAATGESVFGLEHVELHTAPIEELGDFEFDYLICFQATHWFYKSEQYQTLYSQAQRPVLDISSSVQLLDRPEFFQSLFEQHTIQNAYRGFDYPRQLLHEGSYEDRYSAEKVAHGICSGAAINHESFDQILSEVEQVFGHNKIRALISTKVNEVESLENEH